MDRPVLVESLSAADIEKLRSNGLTSIYNDRDEYEQAMIKWKDRQEGLVMRMHRPQKPKETPTE